MGLFVLAQVAVGQTPDGPLANVAAGGGSVRWEISVPHDGGTLTINAPDGRTFRKTFKGGSSPDINLNDKQFEGLPDGVYVYELQLGPVLSAGQKDAAMKIRGKDDDPESERAGRKRTALPVMVQSGSFTIV